MENKKYTPLDKDYIQQLPEMEEPRINFWGASEKDIQHYTKDMEAYKEHLASLPQILRADNGLWKKGQVLVEGVDFEISPRKWNGVEFTKEWFDTAIPIEAAHTQPQSVEALAEQTDIHVKCDDAYDGDAGKDEGSELALWHRKDGGLLATIFFNDISAKAYRSPSYNFSFNAEQANQIRAFLAGQSSNKTINS